MKNLIPLFALLISTSVMNISWSQDNGWSQTSQDAFMKSCYSNGSEGMGTITWSYCSCMLEKIMKKFPDEKSALDISQKWMEKEAKKCLKSAKDQKGNWSAEEQTAFVNSCVKNVDPSLKVDANGYCSCMLEKTMIKYPNVKDAANVDSDWILKEAKNCLKILAK